MIGKLYTALESAEKTHQKFSDKEELRKLTDNQLLPLWSELFSLRHELLTADFAQYKMNLESMPKARMQRDNSVLILVIIDIVAAAGLLQFYTHGLTSRLAILVDNAKRFELKKKLNTPVKGNDEITELDRAFHSMSDSLVLAQQRKQEFLSMISHDMRTPLTNVQASLEFVLESQLQPLSEQTEEWLQRAYQNVETVLSLINELLEIERIEGSGLTLVYSDARLSDIIRRSIDSVRAVAVQHSITIIEPKSTGYLKCDEDRLIRVLVNLLANAIKFAPSGSTVTVDCKKTSQWLEISVQDEGRGIPAELLKTIFERYKQVNIDDARKLGGSGLGLAISKAIIEAHGGVIDVTSELNKGSKFVVSLPASLVEV
ncbi:MAG: HAMP domain-containing histidine kinase [Candidatus Melainabacteria bacterium]|nr:HAMP domain-containing histidine kinase [Candidatus Melainabacteria bacterium]